MGNGEWQCPFCCGDVPCAELSAAKAALGSQFVYQDLRVRSEELFCVRVGAQGMFYSWEGCNP